MPDSLREQVVGAQQIAGLQHAPTDLVEYQRMLRRLQLRLSHEPGCLISTTVGKRFVCCIDQRRYALVVPCGCIRLHRRDFSIGDHALLRQGLLNRVA